MFRRGRLAFGALALVGCGVDPLPEPPVSDPPDAPRLVGDVVADACLACDGPIRVHAGPGSVVDGDTVWVANLDRPSPFVTAPVAKDGSFEVLIQAYEGDELRLQARQDELRSAPVDLRVPPSGVLGAAARPLAGCFALTAELAVAEATDAEPSTTAIRLEHTCAEALQIASIALRAPSADLDVTAPAAPLVLAQTEVAEVVIAFHPTTSGLHEEVLIVEVSAPAIDRRAVTLFGRAN